MNPRLTQPMFRPLTCLFLASAVMLAACGGGSDKTTTVVNHPTAVADNPPPIADAGEDRTVAPGNEVALDGSGSRDPGGDALSYSWRLMRGDWLVTLRGDDTAKPTFTAPNVPEDTLFTFELEVTESGGLSRSDRVRITVSTLPIASITAPSGNVRAGATVTLDGSASTDPRGSRITFQWRQVGDGPRVTLRGAATAMATFTVPTVAQDTTLTFELTVTNANGEMRTQTVQIAVAGPATTVQPEEEGEMSEEEEMPEEEEERPPAVTPNQAPVADAGQGGIANPGATVTLNGSMSRDPDNEDIDYAWTPISGAGFVLDNPDAAMASFPAPNVAQDAELTFTLTVTDDDGATDTDTVTFTINARPVASAGTDIVVESGATVTLSGTDEDDGDGDLDYAWTKTSGPDVTLSDASAQSPTFTAATATAAADIVYTFTLTITDDNDAQNTSQVTVTVNAPPRADAGADQTVGIGATVTIDGSRSGDFGGGDIDYAWSITTNPNPALPALTAAQAAAASFTFTAPTVSAATTYVFSLTVTDANRTDSLTPDTVSIMVLANRAPSAEAGTDPGSITAGDTVSLGGSGTDTETGTLTYAWVQTSGPEVALSDAAIADPEFTAPTGILDITLTFELTVSDSGGLSAKDTVSIAVTGDVDMHVADDHDGPVHGISLSTDGSLAVSGGMDGTVRLWNAQAGAEITFDDGSGGTRTLGQHAGAVYAVAISGDGKRAISGGHGGVLKLWNTDATDTTGYGTEVTYGSGDDSRSLAEAGAGIWIYAVALNADGTRAVSGGFDGQVRLWNTAATGTGAGEEIRTFGSQTDRSLGRHFFTESDGGTPNDPSDDTTFPVSVYAVAISDTGDRVLSGGADGVLRVWNTQSGDEVYALSDDDAMGPVFGVDISRDGNLAVSGSADNHIHVWNISGSNDANPEQIESLTSLHYDFDITSVALIKNETQFVTGFASGIIARWASLDFNNIAAGSFSHSDYVWSVAASGDGAIRASASNDGLILFWDTDTPPRRHTSAATSTILEIVPSGSNANWSGHDVVSHELEEHQRIQSVRLQADGSRLVSTGDDGELYLHDVGATMVTRAETRSRMRHTSRGLERIYGTAISADGRLLASAGGDKSFRWWDAATGDLLYSERAHGLNVFGAAFSPDGSKALSASETGEVFLWDTDAQTRQALQRGAGVNAHDGPARSVALSADGGTAVTGGDAVENMDGGEVRVWNTQMPVDANVRTLRDESAGYAIDNVTSVAVSADGSIVVAGSADGGTGNTTTPYVRAWRLAAGGEPMLQRMERRHTDQVRGVAVSSDGRLALSGGFDDTVHLWDVATGKLLRTMTGHTRDVYSVTLSADGRIAASGEGAWTEPGRVRVWRIGRGHAAAPPRATAVASASANSIRTDGDYVTLDGSGSSGAVAYHWRQTGGPRTASTPRLLDVTNDPAKVAAELLASGSAVGPESLEVELAVTDINGLITTDEVSLSIGDPSPSLDRNHHAGSIVRSVAVSRDGARAVSGDTDGEVRLLRGNNGASIATLASHDGEVYAVAISDDGARAISGGSDGKVRFHNTVTESEITYTDGRSLGDKGIWVYAVALSADARYAASAGFDGKVRFYDTRTGEEKVRFGSEMSDRSLGDHGQSSVYAIAMSADGSRVISGGADGKGYLWNTDTGAKICELTDDDAMGPIFAVDLSQDGTFAVTGGADNHVHTWNILGTNNCPEHSEFPPNTGANANSDVTGVALSNDGTKLAVGTSNGRVRMVRDARSINGGGPGRQAHSNYVWSVALRGDDGVLFSAGADGYVRLWDTAQNVGGQSSFSSAEPIDVDTTTGVAYRSLSGTGDNSHNSENVRGVAMTADGSRGLSGADDAKVILWNLETGAFVRQMERSTGEKAHISRTTGVAISADGSVAASLGIEHRASFTTHLDDSHLRIWNVSEGSQRTSIEFDQDRVTVDNVAVAISANGNRVMIGEKKAGNAIAEGAIRMRVWDWNGSALAGAYEGGNDIGTSVGVLPTSHTLDRRQARGVNAVALNSDGSIAMSGAYSNDNNLRFWDVNAATNRTIHAVSTKNDVNGVALSNDGTVGVSGHSSSTNSVRIWDNGDMVTERSLPGMNQGRNVRGVAVSGDGRFVLSGGEGGTLKLWDAATGAEMRNLKQASGHGDSHINAVSLTPDGRTAFTGGDGGKLFQWFIGRSRAGVPTPSGTGGGPPSLTGTAPGAILKSTAASATHAHCAAPVGSDGRPVQARGPVRGQARGANCVYPASLFGTDNPLVADMTIPALPGGAAHVFQGSLVVGRDAASGRKNPTLTIEAGAVLAFEGASSSLVVNPGARLLAVGTAAQPITLTSRGDAEGEDASGVWGGIQIHGNGGIGDSGHLEFVVVKAAAADATANAGINTGSSDAAPAEAEPPIRRGAITLHNVGNGTVARNLQAYAAVGDGLVLHGGGVRVENFVSVYARGDSIAIAADWSGSLRHALVIQPEHGGDHCLDADGAPGGEAPGAISGLTCITSAHTGIEARGLGAGIRLGANAALTIERSMVVGTFRDDADARANYCLRIDNLSAQTAATLDGNVFACEDQANSAAAAAWATSRNNQFADVLAPTDPTAATDTQLQLLGGTPPVYSLDYDELRINGADTTVTPPAGADFPGAASESAAPSWLRPNGIDWTHGIFEGARDKPLWFEPER